MVEELGRHGAVLEVGAQDGGGGLQRVGGGLGLFLFFVYVCECVFRGVLYMYVHMCVRDWMDEM